MRIDVTQEALADAIATAGRVVPTKSTLPVLSNVLFAVDGTGELSVSGSNLEIGTSHRVKCTVWEPGRTTLPARLLADYVALLDHGESVSLELDAKTHKMHLVCGRQEAHIATIDAEDWPETAGPDSKGTNFTLPCATLKSAIEHVWFAAAPDDTRPVLAGVLMQIKQNVMVLAAADGFRLAVRTLKLHDPVPDVSIIIPAKTMAELLKLLPDVDQDPVTCTIDKNQSSAHFSFGQTEVTTRLIQGQFPDYNRIIPQGSQTQVRITTADALRATRASQVFARDNSHIIRLKVTKDPNTLVIGSVSAESGDNHGTLEAVVEGDASEIAFNGKYLRDALESIDSAEVTILTNGPSSPGILKPTGDQSDASTIYVIMPMHVAR